MIPDINKYRQYVEHYDMSETAKEEFVHAAWSIAQSFVDRAFGDDPTQLMLETEHPKSASHSGPMLEFSRAADGVFTAKNSNSEREEQ